MNPLKNLANYVRLQQGCRIQENIYRSFVFLYPYNEQSENGRNKTIQFTIRIKQQILEKNCKSYTQKSTKISTC